MPGLWINKGMGQFIENPARMAGRFKFSNVRDSTQKYPRCSFLDRILTAEKL